MGQIKHPLLPSPDLEHPYFTIIYCTYHHQELQRDIEQHTEGVASVLTLCDVLLHDADACGSDVENDSIQRFQIITRTLGSCKRR